MFRVSNFWNFFVEGGGAPVPWHNGTMAIPSLTYGATQNVLLDWLIHSFIDIRST